MQGVPLSLNLVFIGIWFRLLGNTTNNCHFRCILYLSIFLCLFAPLFFRPFHICYSLCLENSSFSDLLVWTPSYSSHLSSIVIFSLERPYLMSLLFFPCVMVYFLHRTYHILQLYFNVCVCLVSNFNKLLGLGTSSFTFPSQSPVSCMVGKGFFFYK